MWTKSDWWSSGSTEKGYTGDRKEEGIYTAIYLSLSTLTIKQYIIDYTILI